MKKIKTRYYLFYICMLLFTFGCGKSEEDIDLVTYSSVNPFPTICSIESSSSLTYNVENAFRMQPIPNFKSVILEYERKTGGEFTIIIENKDSSEIKTGWYKYSPPAIYSSSKSEPHPGQSWSNFGVEVEYEHLLSIINTDNHPKDGPLPQIKISIRIKGGIFSDILDGWTWSCTLGNDSNKMQCLAIAFRETTFQESDNCD